MLLAYLDHNVLDSMTKGDPNDVKGFLKVSKLTPVYSDENLAEIYRSKGFENRFLDVLQHIDAYHLIPIVDSSSRYTGQINIERLNSFKAFHSYAENLESQPKGNFGLDELLQKMYGGQQQKSYPEIVSVTNSALMEAISDLLQQINELKESGVMTDRPYEELIGRIHDGGLSIFTELGSKLEAFSHFSVNALDSKFSVGPKHLNNIKGPNVVHKIWDSLPSSLKDCMPDIETFLGIKESGPGPLGPALTVVEKVNRIYHQLNFLGYHRDSGMAKERRYTASISDMTHAGLASYCDILICRDKDLVMKTSATYEFLEVKTIIKLIE